MNPKFTSTRGAASYLRSAPVLYNCEFDNEGFRNYCLEIIETLRVDCPEEGYFSIEDCFIYDGKYVELADGTFLPDSVIDQAHNVVRLGDAIAEARKHNATVTLENDGVPHVFFAKAGAGNYGHFLTDCAVKLVNLPLAIKRPLRLHLPFESAKYVGLVQFLCEQLGLEAEIRVRRFADVAHVPCGIYLSSVAKHNTRKSPTFLELRAAIIARMAGASPSLARRRLYVSRRESEIRHITNRSEVEALFANHGFEIVYPSDFSFSAQVKLFSEATHIAGPLGAGLVNLAWAKEDAKVLMIDPGLVDFYFWDLASQVGQEFFWHFAGTPRPYTTAMELNPYAVDCESLEASIINMLRE